MFTYKETIARYRIVYHEEHPDSVKAEISALQNDMDEMVDEMNSLKSQVIDFLDADTRRPWED